MSIISMGDVGMESIEIGASGVSIDGERIKALALGPNIHIEHFGKDINGDELHAVTITVYTQKLTIHELQNGGVTITTTQAF